MMQAADITKQADIHGVTNAVVDLIQDAMKPSSTTLVVPQSTVLHSTAVAQPASTMMQPASTATSSAAAFLQPATTTRVPHLTSSAARLSVVPNVRCSVRTLAPPRPSQPYTTTCPPSPQVSSIATEPPYYVLPTTYSRTRSPSRSEEFCCYSPPSPPPQVEVPDVDKMNRLDDMIQSMMRHMEEKAERNIAMLMAGIEKRADVDGFMQKVDDKLSDLRCEIVSERASSRQELAQMKVQMRGDLIKDFMDPLNQRIDDMVAQHHGLSHRVAQLESCQQVVVDEARRGQDRVETLRTEVHHLKTEVTPIVQSSRSYGMSAELHSSQILDLQNTVKAMHAGHEAALREVSSLEHACRNDFAKLDAACNACETHSLAKRVGALEVANTTLSVHELNKLQVRFPEDLEELRRVVHDLAQVSKNQGEALEKLTTESEWQRRSRPIIEPQTMTRLFEDSLGSRLKNLRNGTARSPSPLTPRSLASASTMASPVSARGRLGTIDMH